jgi:hypothetical protein
MVGDMSDHISRTANYLRELTDSRHMAFSAIAEIICEPMLARIEALEQAIELAYAAMGEDCTHEMRGHADVIVSHAQDWRQEADERDARIAELEAELTRFRPSLDFELFGPDDLALGRGEITVWLRSEEDSTP